MANRSKWWTVAVGLVLGALVAGCGQGEDGGDAAADGVRTFKVADWLPPEHIAVKEGIEPWMERVAELTDGQVTFDYFPAEQLGAAADLLNLVQSGVADIAMINAPYTPELLQLSSVGGLPGLAQTSCESSWGFYQASRPGKAMFDQEYEDVGLYPLFPQGTPSYELMTTGKRVTGPDDVRGLTIALSGGAIARVADVMGAAPVSMGTPERYEALSRGTVDATLLGFSTVSTYSLEEVLHYSTAGAGLGGSVAPYAMSLETWEQLTPEIQDAFTQATEEALDRYCQAMDRQAIQGRDAMEEAGVEVHDLSEADRAAFVEAAREVNQTWIDEDLPDAKREFGQEVIDDYLAGIEEARSR